MLTHQKTSSVAQLISSELLPYSKCNDCWSYETIPRHQTLCIFEIPTLCGFQTDAQLVRGEEPILHVTRHRTRRYFLVLWKFAITLLNTVPEEPRIFVKYKGLLGSSLHGTLLDSLTIDLFQIRYQKFKNSPLVNVLPPVELRNESRDNITHARPAELTSRTDSSQFPAKGARPPSRQARKQTASLENGVITKLNSVTHVHLRPLTPNRPGFCRVVWPGGGGGEGGRFCPLCNFCLNGLIDLKFGM